MRTKKKDKNKEKWQSSNEEITGTKPQVTKNETRKKWEPNQNSTRITYIRKYYLTSN